MQKIQTTRLWVSAIAMLVLAAPVLHHQAFAQGVTGNELYSLCTADPESVAAYVIGAADTMSLAQSAGWVETKMCLRPGVSAEQLGDVVCSYLAGAPTFRDFAAPALVSLALNRSFPC